MKNEKDEQLPMYAAVTVESTIEKSRALVVVFSNYVVSKYESILNAYIITCNNNHKQLKFICITGVGIISIPILLLLHTLDFV